MKKFGLFLLFSLSSIILLDRVLGLIFDQLYIHMRTGQTGGKINHYLSLPSSPQLVIMGNSRALYQVIPDSFKIPTFNLGHAGMHQIFQTGLLSVMEHEKKIPPSILLHLEPEEFTGEQRNRDIQNLKYYYSKNDRVTEFIGSLSVYERFKFYSSLYRFNGRALILIKNYVFPKEVDSSFDGYEPVERTRRDSINTLYSLGQEVDQPELGINPKQLTYLKEFIDICSRNNVRLICFTSPHFKSTRKQERTSFLLDSLLEMNHIEYINYSVRPIAGLEVDAGLWRDIHHLNHDGAQIESGILAKSVMEILKSTH